MSWFNEKEINTEDQFLYSLINLYNVPMEEKTNNMLN